MIQSTVTKMDFALYSVWELWFTQKAKAPRTSKVAESGVCNVALKSWSFLKILAKWVTADRMLDKVTSGLEFWHGSVSCEYHLDNAM